MANISLPKIEEKDYALPVSLGGLGSVNLIDGAKNIELATYALLNAPNGILASDALGNVPLSAIPSGVVTVQDCVNGSSKLAVNKIGYYTINNYDNARVYTISEISGSVSRSGRTITYTAPSTTGTSGFIINGRTINISIISAIVVTPVISFPVNLSTGVGKNITVVSNIYVPTDSLDYHEYSDWEISTDNTFNTVVFSSYSDKTNLNSILVSGLTTATVYYLRVRYNSTVNGLSPWSSTIQFTTTTADIISTQQSFLSKTDKASNEVFGYSTCISRDGTRMVVSGKGLQYDQNTITGGFIIYKYDSVNKKWIEEQILYHPLLIGYQNFGKSVAINNDGTRIVVGSSTMKSPTNVSGTGCVYIYVRNTTTNVWTQEAYLSGTDSAFKDRFGYSVDIDDSGTRIIVGAIGVNLGTVVAQGAAYVFVRNTTTNVWTQEAKLAEAAASDSSWMGKSVSITGAGDRVAIGGHAKDVGGVINCGAVLIYTRSVSTWTLQTTLSASDKAANDYFGYSVSLNQLGDRLVVGAPNCTVSGTIQSGAVYIFNRAGTVWTQAAKINASDKIESAKYGCSVKISTSGTKIVIGSSNKTISSVTSTGCAYVNFFNGTTWTEEYIAVISDYKQGDRTGWTVSMDGTGKVICVGSPQKNTDYVIASGAVTTFF